MSVLFPQDAIFKTYSMKLIAFILIMILMGCNRRYCQPTPRSADWSVKSVRANNDGSAIVKLARYEAGGGLVRKTVLFECLPDSIKSGVKYFSLLKQATNGLCFYRGHF